MLTVNDIKKAVSDVITKYPIKKISLFGSYADGTADESSDVDMLIEFLSPGVSLLMLYDIKEGIAAKLQRDVDLIHGPLDKNSFIKISKVIDIYEQ